MNINNPSFWDTQFEAEYEAMEKLDGYVRWSVLRFEAAATSIQGKKVLEIGCGLGHLARFLKARNPLQGLEVTGIDYSPFAIEKAKELDPGGDYQVADVLDLPFKDGEYDTVIALEVIEHVDDYKKVLTELNRVAKRCMIIATPRADIGHNPSEDHVREFTMTEMQELGSQFGRVEVVLDLVVPWVVTYVIYKYEST